MNSDKRYQADDLPAIDTIWHYDKPGRDRRKVQTIDSSGLKNQQINHITRKVNAVGKDPKSSSKL